MEKLKGDPIVIDGKRIVLSCVETGLVFATSPDVKGLLVAKRNRVEAIAAVHVALVEIEQAEREWAAMSDADKAIFAAAEIVGDAEIEAEIVALEAAGQEWDDHAAAINARFANEAAKASAEDWRLVHEIMECDHESLALMGDTPDAGKPPRSV
jgi:hypothetical protein